MSGRETKILINTLQVRSKKEKSYPAQIVPITQQLSKNYKPHI